MRKKISKGKSNSLFRNTASGTNVANLKAVTRFSPRGGIRFW